MGEARLREYTPFVDARLGGGDGDAYLAYLERTVKPLVDRRFRTRPERDATGVFGSSLGGLISLYAFFRAPETFGFVGAMSPSVWFANRVVLTYIERDGTPPGRLYIDTGTDEGSNTLRDARQLASLLTRKGYAKRSTAVRRGARRQAQRGGLGTPAGASAGLSAPSAGRSTARAAQIAVFGVFSAVLWHPLSKVGIARKTEETIACRDGGIAL